MLPSSLKITGPFHRCFCETGYFTVVETEQIMNAELLWFKAKIHVQFNSIGGFKG
jgi:imidazolonepropionase